MANEVYANNREISCKAASGKSIAAFPDVCFTPPQTPPMPLGIPIPYPNTGLSKDTTKGTRTIRKKDLIHNAYQPKMEVDPETYQVRADGELLTCEPASVLPLAQRYSLF